jgi:thiol-disulfide isomerase/thioredoxin
MKKYAVSILAAIIAIIPVKGSYWKAMAIYAACDSACFFVKTETRSKDLVSVSNSSMYYAIKRLEKPSKWYSYNIFAYNPDLYFTKFINNQKIFEMYKADSNINAFVNYTKPHTDGSVPMDFAFLPIHQGSGGIFSVIPKKVSENENSEFYKYKSRNYQLIIEIDKSNSLIKSCEYQNFEDDSLSIKYEYQYAYLKAGKKYIYTNPTKERFIPVSLDNKNILSKLYETFNKNKVTIFKFDTGAVSSLLYGFFEKDKKYLLIDFWHISCYPCLKLLPVMDSLSRLEDQVSIRLINVLNPEEDVIHFKKRKQFTFQHYCDTGDIIENYFKPTAYPTLILLDKKLQVLAEKTGNDRAALMDIYRKTLE